MSGWLDAPINMGDFDSMKTTLELPDSTYRRAKATAARRGQTMGAFITAAVEAKLAADERARQEKPWLAFAGVFQGEGEESRRVLERIEAECGRIEPGEWA